MGPLPPTGKAWKVSEKGVSEGTEHPGCSHLPAGLGQLQEDEGEQAWEESWERGRASLCPSSAASFPQGDRRPSQATGIGKDRPQ